MAYDEYLAERIAKVLHDRHVPFEAKKMMGGICYLVDDKMCAGIIKNKLMARIDPVFTEMALKRPGSALMDFTGKTMKGFLFIDPEGIDMEHDLEYWIDLCLEFNPRAVSSKKKK
jgi:TfoX/Sxy family transcriptional regulator of competence genes